MITSPDERVPDSVSMVDSVGAPAGTMIHTLPDSAKLKKAGLLVDFYARQYNLGNNPLNKLLMGDIGKSISLKAFEDDSDGFDKGLVMKYRIWEEISGKSEYGEPIWESHCAVFPMKITGVIKPLFGGVVFDLLAF